MRTIMLVARRLGRDDRRRARRTARTATTTLARRRSAATLCLFWLLGAASATASNQIHFLKCQYSHVNLQYVISRMRDLANAADNHVSSCLECRLTYSVMSNS